MTDTDSSEGAQRWRRIDELFDLVMDLPPAERSQLLDQHCKDDPDLRAAVERLLRADARAEDFLEASPRVETSDRSGERIGPYRLSRKIGEGGMSEVYLAEREDGTYEGQVAIKLVRAGFERDVVFSRFVAERQILAGLQHPRIARLFDGGATEDGQPYLVMEHVEGEPITDYCDRHQLSLRQRLELFEKLCEAVDHAHRNLLVHRDIKPANILVTDDGHPMLLDFGIAKLLQPPGELGPDPTLTATTFLTPRYASPEQVRGEPITTATDTYSLGVLLYELLTGRLPYADTSRRYEIEQAILAQPPPPPSSAVESATDADDAPAPRLSRSRARRIPGDLDRIVLKALRKEAERRYRSASDLGADVRRFLDRRPIEARPDTLSYRLRKFAERNRLATVMGALALLAILTFTVALVIQARRLADERDRARIEGEKSEAALDFLTTLFDTAGPSPERLSVREVLDRGAERIESELGDRPELQGILLLKIIQIYFNLSEFERSKPLIDRYLELRRRQYGERHIEYAEALLLLGEWHSINGDFETSRDIYGRALELARRALPEDDARMLSFVQSFGLVLGRLGDHREAERLHREALELEIAINGPESAGVAAAHSFLGSTLNIAGDFEGAIAEFRAADPVFRKNGGDLGQFVAQNLTNLSNALSNTERFEEAIAAARDAQQIQDAIYEEHNVERGYTSKALGRALHGLGDLEAAESAFTRAVDVMERNFGRRHYGIGITLHQLATTLRDQDRFDAAQTLYLESIDILEEAYGENGAQIAPALLGYGDLLVLRGELQEAEPHLRRALALLEDQPPISSAIPLAILGECLVGLGQSSEGRALLMRGRALLAAVVPDTDERIIRIDRVLGRSG